MKNTLLLLLLAILAIACQKDESIGLPELLYQRWHLDRTKPIGSGGWIMYNVDGIYDTEYRPDGMLLYRRNGVIISAICCKPTQFSRSKTIIGYNDPNYCLLSLCAGVVKTETIQQLTNDLLELNDGAYITQYKAVR